MKSPEDDEQCAKAFVLLSRSRVAKIHADNSQAPLDKVCLLSCGVPTGFGSARNVANVRRGSTVGVWGLGTIGLAAVCGAKSAGASMIVGVDINVDKDQLSRKFGVTHFINPEDGDVVKVPAAVDQSDHR